MISMSVGYQLHVLVRPTACRSIGMSGYILSIFSDKVVLIDFSINMFTTSFLKSLLTLAKCRNRTSFPSTF
jgi:hypothetical protein